MTNQKFEIAEALEDVRNTLENGYEGSYADLHNEVFNTDYYIIGTYQAKEALNEYGVFDAIREITEFEKDNFGEIDSEHLTDPEKMANVLYYIKGEHALQLNPIAEEINNLWDETADEKTNAYLVSIIDTMLEEMGA